MKNSTIYLTGTGISSFGDGIHMVALSLALLDSTNSALAIGLMIATYYVPVFLLSPFAGVFCDNRDAKRIVVLTELSRFLLILGMAYMIHFHNDVILPLYLLQALLATARVLFKPASRTVIREAFDMNGCVKTFSLGSTIGLITTIVGSGLGGWLITNQPAVLCFIINALTYLVSAIAYTLLERLFRAELPATSGAYWPQIKAACRFVSLQPGMLSILVFSMIGSASYRLVITILPIYVARDLGGDNNLFTLMNVAFIAGGAAGGICVWRLLKTFGQWTAVVTFAGIAFFSLLLGLLDQTGLLMIALFGMGFVTIALLSAMNSLINTTSPQAMLGRIVSLQSIMAAMSKAISASGAGFLAELTTSHHIFLIFGLLVGAGLATLALASWTQARPVLTHAPINA